MRENPSSLLEEILVRSRVNVKNNQIPPPLLKEEITEVGLPVPGKKGQGLPRRLDRVRGRTPIRSPSVRLMVNIILGSVGCWGVVVSVVEIKDTRSVIVRDVQTRAEQVQSPLFKDHEHLGLLLVEAEVGARHRVLHSRRAARSCGVSSLRGRRECLP